MYSWFDENGALISDDSSIIQDPENSTFFMVEVTDSCGNQLASSVTDVQVLPAFVETSLPSDIFFITSRGA